MARKVADTCLIRDDDMLKSGHELRDGLLQNTSSSLIWRLIMAYGNIAAIGKCTLGTNVAMPNNIAIMNDSNIVMLCDDMVLTGTHTANDVLFTLPDSSMFPNATLTLLGVFQPTSGSRTTRVFQVDTSGNFTCTNPTAGTYYLNGFMWHNNSKYYSSAIGNIGGYTSPLSAR